MRLGIKRSVWTAVGAALASLVLVAGCNGSAASPSPSESSEAAADYTVIATTSVFADLAQLALGDNVTIETIIRLVLTSTRLSHPPPTRRSLLARTSSS